MKRILCLIIIFAIVLGITSCSKYSGDNLDKNQFNEGKIWWDDTITKISPDEIKKEFSEEPFQLSYQFYAADEDSFVVSFQAYAKTIKTNTLLRRYSYDGKLLGQIILGEFFGYDAYYYPPSLIIRNNDKYYTVINHYNKTVDTYVVTAYEIDFDNGVLHETADLFLPEEVGINSQIVDLIAVGEKRVFLSNVSNKNGTFIYKFYVANGSDYQCFVPDFGNNVSLRTINNLMNTDDGISFVASVIDNGLYKTLYCILNIDNFEFQTVEVDDKLEDARFISGCGFFDLSDENKVKMIEPKGGDESVLIDLADTYVNGQYSNRKQIVWASEDKVVFITDEMDISGNLASPSIVLLDKVNDDPNYGKKILSITSLDEMTSQEYFAVNDFNRNSKDYFIEVNTEYYDKPDKDNFDPNVIANKDVDSVTRLMADIRSGSGPDLVIYNNMTAQIDSTDYLIDLSERIKAESNLSPEEYMSFVFQPNGRDGKHYRLNYAYSFCGIVIDKSYVDGGTKGLTFDQYDRMINEYNQGTSVLPETDLATFKTLLTGSDYFSFDQKGAFSLEGKGFNKMAEYIYTIPDNTLRGGYSDAWPEKIAFLSGGDFKGFAMSFGCVYSNYSIVGIPSVDGHSETINGRGIGITSCCSLQDAAWSFVMKMMSQDIQLRTVYNDPVSISAQKSIYEDYINAYNAVIRNSDTPDLTIPDGIVDSYIEELSDSMVVPDTDSSIIIVFNEEMPAYFEGQKSLNEVTEIIENRVNLVLSERG